MSPDDKPGELLERIADFVGAGVPYIWIVDLYRRTVAAIEEGAHRQISGLILEIPLVGAIDFAELLRQLDEKT